MKKPKFSNESNSAPISENSKLLQLTERQTRALSALRNAAGWIGREQIDRIAGASNGPQIILELRRKFGYDAIDMRRTEAVDRYGRRCLPGQYTLTEKGRALVKKYWESNSWGK